MFMSFIGSIILTINNLIFIHSSTMFDDKIKKAMNIYFLKCILNIFVAYILDTFIHVKVNTFTSIYKGNFYKKIKSKKVHLKK